jgi:hypothetical protein
MPPKIEILVFFKNKKNSMCRRSTKVYVHHLNFQYNKFLYVFFIVKKTAFVCEFQHTPLLKMIFCLNVPHLLWI